MKLAALARMERPEVARSRRPRGAWIIGVASLVQVVLMAWLFRTESVTVTGLVAAGLALGLGWSWGRNWLHPIARVAVVTAALGGLGMLVGTWIDMAQSAASTTAGAEVDPAALSCHLHGTGVARLTPDEAAAEPSHELGKMATSWMFVLMLIACVGGCAWLCDDCERRPHRRLLEPIACAGGMILGMMLGGNLAGSFAAWSGLGAGVAMHSAMVVGMAAGSATSRALLQALAQPRHAALSTHTP